MTSQEEGDLDPPIFSEAEEGALIPPFFSEAGDSTIGALREEPYASDRCTYGQTARPRTERSDEMNMSHLSSCYDYEFTEVGAADNDYDIDEERILVEAPAHSFNAHRPLTLASFRRLPAMQGQHSDAASSGQQEPSNPAAARGQGGRTMSDDGARALNLASRVVAGPHSLLRNLNRDVSFATNHNNNNVNVSNNADVDRDFALGASEIGTSEEIWATERDMFRTEDDERGHTRVPSPDNDQLSGASSEFSFRITTEAPTACTSIRGTTIGHGSEYNESKIRGSGSNESKIRGSDSNESKIYGSESSKPKEGSKRFSSNRRGTDSSREETCKSRKLLADEDQIHADVVMQIQAPTGRRNGIGRPGRPRQYSSSAAASSAAASTAP